MKTCIHLSTIFLIFFIFNYSSAQTNVTLGPRAGANAAQGGNTLIGQNSGVQFKSTLAACLGYNSAYNANVYAGVMVGLGAGAQSTGYHITMVGPNAGQNSKTSDYSVFMGHSAGQSAYGAKGSVFVGRQVGYGNRGIHNTAMGFQAYSGSVHTTSKITKGSRNVMLGAYAGYNNTNGNNNVYIGWRSGVSQVNSSASYNVAVGLNSGSNFSNATYNTLTGYYAGERLTSGSHNTAFGNQAGRFLTTGSTNTLIGRLAGYRLTTGQNNTVLGNNTGAYITSGKHNVFLGSGAGNYLRGGTSNKLVIHNNGSSSPLIEGDFSARKVVLRGKVGINTANTPTYLGGRNTSGYNLFVKGGIATQAILVSTTSWADYVFEDNYNLMPLAEVANFIAENKHLPNMPSEKEVVDNGLELSEITTLQQEKIEELTLYIIDQDKKMQEQEQRIQKLEELINAQNK